MALPKWLYPWKTNSSHPSIGPVYPASVQEIEWEPKARPVYLAGVINTTKNAIRNSGLDIFEDFWHNSSSYNMTNWALWYNAMLEFFTNHNAQSAQVIVTDTSLNTTSQASFTLTCATGHAYKVISTGLQNNTRNPQPDMVYTPSGGTAVTMVGEAGSQDETYNHIGSASGGAGRSSGMMIPLWMQAGDTLTLTDSAFVAADGMRHYFIFEDYTL